MNKTVNINLANTFFHIDEVAYGRLHRYLEAIKRSFSGTPGSDEIIADIESRIAELFRDRMENDLQVITQKEVDEVITIMGQPEDYLVDEDIFEDEPIPKQHKKKTKKLYRDIEHKYIGGVCAGLVHYLRIDALWIRIFFILLAIGGSGFGVIAYIILWILVPEATTTAEKLHMTGEAVNISSIERKVKEGIDDVADKVKNADYGKMGQQVKKTGQSFFETLGDILMFLVKIFGKLVGVLIFIVGAATLLTLSIGLFTMSILDQSHAIPGFDFYEIVDTAGMPIWLISLLTFFTVGIPFFFVMYLGLKIMVSNLKSIGKMAKFTLLGIWLISVSVLIFYGIKQATARAYTGSSSQTEQIYFEAPIDTMFISARSTELYDRQEDVGINGMTLSYKENGDRVLFDDQIRLNIKKSEDSLVHVKVRKDADGSSFQEARERAERIDYTYRVKENQLVFDDFLSTDVENKVMDQKVRVTLFIPEGTILKMDGSLNGHIGYSIKNDYNLSNRDLIEHTWVMGPEGTLLCQDCTEDDRVKRRGDRNKIIIDENGIDIDVKDDDGETFQLKINEEGVLIDAKDNEKEKMHINIDGQNQSVKIKTVDEEGKTVTKSVTKD
jgi:phage shock protein PspC (stress-responsive transcriptional regulator)